MGSHGAMAGGGGLAASSWMVVSSGVLWVLASLVIGLLANRLPEGWLEAELLPSRSAVRRGEGGRLHGRPPGIRVWKRWIPDAGPALPGGIAKATLVRRDPASLRRLLVETRRAALVHWVLWGAVLVTPLWLPPAGVLVNLLFATAFNLPCLVLQSDTRRRLLRCLARLQASQ